MNSKTLTTRLGHTEENPSYTRTNSGTTSLSVTNGSPCFKRIGLTIQDSYTHGLHPSNTMIATFLSWLVSVMFSISILVVVPLWFYNFDPTTSLDISKLAKRVIIGWTSLLHVSAWLLLVIISFVGLFIAQKCYYSSSHNCTETCVTSSRMGKLLNSCASKTLDNTRALSAVTIATFVLGFSFAVCIAIQSNLQMIHPSWAWNPFLWGGYHVFKPESISKALEGLCLDYEFPDDTNVRFGPGKRLAKKILKTGSGDDQNPNPLCLSESKWRTLSTEALSSRSEADVKAVIDGLRYAKYKSGGLIISIMARDTVGSIEPLRQNVEGLLPFLSKLSVVVFENDSSDGSREAFYSWSGEVSDYKVDLIECDVPSCRFHENHRDFDTTNNPYSKTSAIGRMAEFRNLMVDHILETPEYAEYSHILVLDMDLGVSISPLGLIQTLGILPEEAVASSGRQVWPGSFGTIIPPYDFSAFQAHETASNKKLLLLHEKFCSLKPKGDRWRNECNAVSPMHTMMVLGEDRLSDQPYMVDSAFNGATLYPIDLIRRTQARYDVGDDGQRCEHIGFNLSLKQPMYVNPRWTMHISPNAPGGPTGKRAFQTIRGIASSPVIGPIIFFQNLICMMFFVYSVLTLSMKVVYPFWVKLVSGSSFFDVATSCRDEDSSKNRLHDASPTDLEFLLNPEIHASPRKRKVSDFDAV